MKPAVVALAELRSAMSMAEVQIFSARALNKYEFFTDEARVLTRALAAFKKLHDIGS